MKRDVVQASVIVMNEVFICHYSSTTAYRITMWLSIFKNLPLLISVLGWSFAKQFVCRHALILVFSKLNLRFR